MSLSSQNNYEINVFGQPDDSWLDLFGETKTRIEIQEDDIEVTTISNAVIDQAGSV